MSGGRLDLLRVCGKEDGESKERESKHSLRENEEEEGGEQDEEEEEEEGEHDSQLDQQAGRHVCNCLLYWTLQFSTVLGRLEL